MNVNKSSLFWGVLLIGGGVLALAQQMGYIHQLSETVWTVAIILTGAYLFFTALRPRAI
jgi:hypothetical protein